MSVVWSTILTIAALGPLVLYGPRAVGVAIGVEQGFKSDAAQHLWPRPMKIGGIIHRNCDLSIVRGNHPMRLILFTEKGSSCRKHGHLSYQTCDLSWFIQQNVDWSNKNRSCLPSKGGFQQYKKGIPPPKWLPDGAGSQAIQRHLRYGCWRVPGWRGDKNKLWIYVAIDSIDKMNKFQCILYYYCIWISI